MAIKPMKFKKQKKNRSFERIIIYVVLGFGLVYAKTGMLALDILGWILLVAGSIFLLFYLKKRYDGKVKKFFKELFNIKDKEEVTEEKNI